ncbi:hypothetical protein Sjap_004423 [Stephania japonica]|uniref:Uncharacterized protein n=1 Tax=Stephania japonica TaxID=461633 RepID=A0AAP0PK91_9MAGN
MTTSNESTTIYIPSSSDDDDTTGPSRKPVTVLALKSRSVTIVGLKNHKNMNTTTNNNNNNNDDNKDDVVSKVKTETKTTTTTTNGTYIYCSSDNDDSDSDDDCVVLDFDPFESIDLSKKLSISNADQDRDLVVMAEKRQVIACRDYPHSRHLCAKYPFSKTPHQIHCEQCYCYVCDLAAPCKFWSGDLGEHCNASNVDPKWKTIRQTWKVEVAK